MGTDSELGMQLGFVLDIAVSDMFKIQPGLMYAQKAMTDGERTKEYFELPLLLFLKLSALRLNAGPYFGICLGSCSSRRIPYNFGLSTGVGLDIGRFYIGAFSNFDLYPLETLYGYLGLNVGVNW